MKIPSELLTAPNLLTAFRIVCAPVLLVMAWQGYATAFMALLVAAFLSDALDGLVARLSGQVSQFGAKLDSWADAILFSTITVSAWWLWPEIVRREAVYVGVVMASYLLPAIVGYLKFRAVTSYHTWIVKFAVATVGLSLFVLFLGGPAWPFRLGTALCVLAAVEEIAITAVSTELHSDVRSLLDVLKHLSRKKQG
jgi:CDP-diacylglycerol--glycerol-3-phosphate 3-phosphatidyltransferase